MISEKGDKDRFRDLCKHFVLDNPSEASFEDVKFILENLGFKEGKGQSASVLFKNPISGDKQVVPKSEQGKGKAKKIKPITSRVIQQIVVHLKLWNYVQQQD